MIKIIDFFKEEENVLLDEILKKRNYITTTEITKTVEEIINNVQKNGDSALQEYTKKFDRVNLDKYSFRVSQEEIKKAYQLVNKELIEIIRRSKKNIEDFHKEQKEKSWFINPEAGVTLGQLYRPIEKVGVYVPGGTAPLPSSVLMNVVPAKIAGVEKVVMATPSGVNGQVNPAILVAANEIGVEEIYRVGGAQAIAALAFGTNTISKVDKIVGPGNIYVATAKKMVYGHCDIDMVAGPSEITVIADESANPSYVAADLLSQAEHDKLASSILITTSKDFAHNVNLELKRQSSYLLRKDIIKHSLENYGAIVVVKNIEDAIEVSNKIVPEHLELCVKEPFSYLGLIKNAGAIFLGNYSTEPLGDYYAGPNHVLPTSGTARFFSPLSVNDFIKKSSIISYSKSALDKVKNDIILFAESEGLTAHANAINIRFNGKR